MTVALLLSACRLDVVAEVVLSSDGSGTAALVLELDRELLGELDELGVDVIGGVERAAADAPGWELEIGGEHDEGLELRLAHDGGDPFAALGELSAGLAPEDPGLQVDVEARVDDEGAATIDGSVRLQPPAAPGAVDESGDGQGLPPAPDAGELAGLVAEHVHGQLRVALPGPVERHDADGLEDGTLWWDLPAGETVDVHAVSGPPTRLPLVLALGAGAVLLVGALGGLWWWRRRRGAAALTRGE